MKKIFKQGITLFVALAIMISAVPVLAESVVADSGVCVDGGSHTIQYMEKRKPTYTEAGWDAYEFCSNEECSYSTFVAIPALGEPEINNFEEFVMNLNFLEALANMYIEQYPGNDPLELIIKYIRTGVDRYNSGSWGIMAGYENTDFANFVRRTENMMNLEFEYVEEYYKFTGLKNINPFYLPNGDYVDIGHMFGTMDISYTNKGSQNHADVGGWAGDLVDLMTSADLDGVSGTVEEMVTVLKDSYFLNNPQEHDVFSLSDFYGDLDAYYVLNTILDRGYAIDPESEIGPLTMLMMEYFTEELTVEDRAKYFLKTRLNNVGTREQVRRAVYNAYTGNMTLTTLEATREFITDQENINNLRKASCYVFADYICSLAGDYIEIDSNPYYDVFNTIPSTLAPGVTHETNYATTADGKQIVYYVATADLSNPNVSVYANYNNNDPSKGWGMSRVMDQANAAQAKYGDPESADYIENYQVVAAVNADGYDMTNGEPGGLLVMRGIEYHPINASGFFGITKDGEAVIGTTAEYNSTYKGKLRDAVGAFGVTLVKDGKIAVKKSDNYTADRASRTSVGITKTGKVVFMVLDGRQEPRSCGGSMEEIAQIMLEAGCYKAVNLDGGGSTTFVSRPEGKTELEVTSSPSDGFARSVSTSLMMVSTAPSSTKFDHARLDSEYSYATVNTEIEITPVGLSATGNVVPLPDEYSWSVTGGASITDDGIFSAGDFGSYTVQLLSDGEIIGQKTIEVVEPDNVYFERKSMDAVYGSTLSVPIKAVYSGKAVAINENDVELSVSPRGAGTFDGYNFIAAENTSVKSATITASIPSGAVATMTVSIYKQGENTFDFDKATGGDRQLAWDRQVSNAVSDDATAYIAENPNEPMETSYIFAIDMKEIPIPSQLEDLLYMLPGADADNDGVVDTEASAWKFLLQLAERVSVLTTVKPVLKFDERFDIDYSDIKVISEYFYLDGAELNEETNELALTLKWHDQTAAIKAETANSLCMLNGIKLTPKSGTWDSVNKINVVHTGDIGYKIYLRANALHTFAKKEENQAIYGLYPFENTFIDPNGDEQYEAGGYFESTYKTFEDRYTLSVIKKNGWINEEGGFAYYIDGVKLTGVAEADGYYYDFGTNGINVGQTKYTGFFEKNGKKYYVRLGELMKSAWQLVDNDMYHCHDNGEAYLTSQYESFTCVRGGYVQYTCKKCSSKKLSTYIFPGGHEWDENHVCMVAKCKAVGTDINTITINFGTLANPWKGKIPTYAYKKAGVTPGFYGTADGVNVLTFARGAIPNDDGTMRDLDVSYTNNEGVGYALINFLGTGNYYGEKSMEFFINAPAVKDLKATKTTDSITLSWGYDYANIYRYEIYNAAGTLVGHTTSKSYKISNLTPGTQYTYSVMARAWSSDDIIGKTKKVYSASKVSVTATTDTLPEVIHYVSDVSAGSDYDVNLITTDDNTHYLMLPSHSNIASLPLSFTAQSLLNGLSGTISGDKGSVAFTAKTGANTCTVDLSQLATANGNCYDIKIKVGNYQPTQIKVVKGSDIPSMFISSADASKDREFVDSVKGNEATGNMMMIDSSGTGIYNGELTQIKARGNSTFTYYDKKAYQIKLADKTDLLGNGEKVKTWILLANYVDATLMHDKLMKDLAKQMGLPYVASTNWVNLWYDGEYRGVYLVTEKNSVNSTSVDITDMEKEYEKINSGYGEDVTAEIGHNDYGCEYKYTTGLTDPENITGGYLIELNKTQYDEINGFKTKKGKGFNLKAPEWLSENAVKYISEYYQEFEDAVYAVDANGKYTGYNEETGKYFYDYVDIDSLVRMVVIHGLGANPDGFISSVYFSKDADGIMYIGPIWDQDITMGTGWAVANPYNVDVYTNRYLVEALLEIPVFKHKVAKFFEDTAKIMIENMYKDGGTIDTHYDVLNDNALMNYILWPYIKIGYPNANGHIWAGADYDSVVADMKSWLTKRLAYLEEKLIPEYDLGDANGDGVINSVDAVLILRSTVGYTDDNFNIKFTDVNDDGVTNSVDAVLILRYTVGYEDENFIPGK